MFVSLVKGKYQIIAAQDTYWSCFTYDGQTPDELHCTHKYFGEQSPEAAEQILKTLNEHFAEKPFKPFAVPFTEEEFFGDDGDTRVLTPDAENASLEPFLMDLRAKLDRFAEDNHPSYRPHVSTDEHHAIDLPLTGYAFCLGDKILKAFP